jgi:hypothetical protein
MTESRNVFVVTRPWRAFVMTSAEINQEALSSQREVVTGVVERVTSHNAENGFCVLRAKVRGHRDLITVGHAATISAGEWITGSIPGRTRR